MKLKGEAKTRHDELQEQAEQFHKDHPEIWQLFCKFTFDLIERGFKHYSSRDVFAMIRWSADKPTPSGRTSWKISNDLSAFYGRWFQNTYPEHGRFFMTKTQTSKFRSANGKSLYHSSDHPDYAS